MGNRAVITTERKDLGVYLHWNGGKDSVQAFLKYCELKGYASPEYDTYGWARLCQVIGNFFGGTNSVGISRYEESDRDNFDNGVYIIRNWQIVGREYFKGGEQLNYDLEDMLNQMRQMQKLGSMSSIMGMLPGLAKYKEQIESVDTDAIMKKQEAIILSMTPKERRHPDIIKASRKKRIAQGSGVEVHEVNKLLKSYEQMSTMMKQMGKLGSMKGLASHFMKKNPFGGNPFGGFNNKFPF